MSAAVAAREIALPALLVAISAGILALVQPPLARFTAAVKETSDVFPLPPLEQLPVFTLGYDSAAADALWAHTLVVQGLRMQQRRHFDHGALYFESLLALDPSFREPYLYVDAVLTFSAVRASYDDIVATRRILERGAAARPTDAEIAYQAGSFIAYVAPSYLPTEEEKQQWEREGAKYLARAAEIGSSDPRIQSLALGGAALLSKRGERAAALSMLERAFAVASDEDARESIRQHLVGLRAAETEDGVRAHVRRFEEAWREDLPFVSLGKTLVLGPPVPVMSCVGARSRDRQRCRRTWKARLNDR